MTLSGKLTRHDATHAPVITQSTDLDDYRRRADAAARCGKRDCAKYAKEAADRIEGRTPTETVVL